MILLFLLGVSPLPTLATLKLSSKLSKAPTDLNEELKELKRDLMDARSEINFYEIKELYRD